MLALLAILIAAPALAQDGPPSGLIGTAIALNGDTIHLNGYRVGLFGIAAPEMKAALGAHARGALDDLLAAGPVDCTVIDEDRYERPVAVCHGADGHDLAIAQLENGWATSYRIFTVDTAYQAPYDEAEAVARAAGLGLWAAPDDSATSWADHFDRFQTFIVGMIGFIGVWGTTWLGFRNASEGRRHDATLARTARREEFDLDRERDDTRRDYEAKAVAAAIAAGLENLETSAIYLLVCLESVAGGNETAMPDKNVDAERFWPPSLDIFKAHVERIGILGPTRAAHAGYWVNYTVSTMKTILFNFYEEEKGSRPTEEDLADLKETIGNIGEVKTDLMEYAGVQNDLFIRGNDQAKAPEE